MIPETEKLISNHISHLKGPETLGLWVPCWEGFTQNNSSPTHECWSPQARLFFFFDPSELHVVFYKVGAIPWLIGAVK